jgi:hypothetical protein
VLADLLVENLVKPIQKHGLSRPNVLANFYLSMHVTSVSKKEHLEREARNSKAKAFYQSKA